TVRGWTRAQSDSTSGTLLWMAPELFEGSGATLQSDLYSLGVMLYQIVLGDFGRILAPDWHPDIEDDVLREDIDAVTRRN
ncbi:protein kinase, partial [Acinetobacter baumannii]